MYSKKYIIIRTLRRTLNGNTLTALDKERDNQGLSEVNGGKIKKSRKSRKSKKSKKFRKTRRH